MKLSSSPVPPGVAEAGLRALKTVCSLGGITALERQFLDAVQRHILRTELELDALAPITPEELATRVPPGELRERVLGGMVIAACIDGEASPDELRTIEAYAKALGIDSDIVRTGRHLADEQMLLARIDIARRALPGFKMKEVFREDGLPGAIKQFLPTLGLGNEATANRYRALADYAPGTLGRAYYDFVTSNGFPLPGEKHAGPEIVVTHDCIHVLGGYGTTPEEEVQVAAFQAGCHHANEFHALLFGLAQFHLGVQMAPMSTPETLRADPDSMLRAFARGSAVPQDFWAAFRPWDQFARPVEDVRAEFGIGPR